MQDFCRRCVLDCKCARLDTLTEPEQIEAEVVSGDLRMVAAYECRAGHRWTTRFTEPLHAELKG